MTVKHFNLQKLLFSTHQILLRRGDLLEIFAKEQLSLTFTPQDSGGMRTACTALEQSSKPAIIIFGHILIFPSLNFLTTASSAPWSYFGLNCIVDANSPGCPLNTPLKRATLTNLKYV